MRLPHGRRGLFYFRRKRLSCCLPPVLHSTSHLQSAAILSWCALAAINKQSQPPAIAIMQPYSRLASRSITDVPSCLVSSSLFAAPVGGRNKRGLLYTAALGEGTFVRALSAGADDSRRVFVDHARKPRDTRVLESVEAGHTSHAVAAQVCSDLGITLSPIRVDGQCKYGLLSEGQVNARAPPACMSVCLPVFCLPCLHWTVSGHERSLAAITCNLVDRTVAVKTLGG